MGEILEKPISVRAENILGRMGGVGSKPAEHPWVKHFQKQTGSKFLKRKSNELGFLSLSSEQTGSIVQMNILMCGHNPVCYMSKEAAWFTAAASTC